MLLEAKQVRKRFGAVRALKGVDLQLQVGEIVALAGENGSGKSTLSRIIAGLIRPDAGTITITGKHTAFTGPSDALQAGIGIVTQERTAVGTLSVAENILLQGRRTALSIYRRRTTLRRAEEYIERVGLKIDPTVPYARLSPGQAVLAEIARALVSDPRILILDEATAQIGGKEVLRVFALMKELASAGTGLIMVTHRLSEVLQIADRTVVLRDGQLVGEISQSDASEERISSMMVGRKVEDLQRRGASKTSRIRLEIRELLVKGMSAPVNLSVKSGEIVGLAGLVGAGRTEVLETIAGLRHPEGGEILVDKKAVTLGKTRAALEAGIVLVPEERRSQGLVLGAKVSSNVALGYWKLWSKASRSQERNLLDQYSNSVNLRIQPGMDPPVRALSGGNQQKVVFARALSRDPKVMLLDEPTRGIDVGARQEIFTLIDLLLDSGMAIVMATSDMRELLALSHRIVVLHDRRIVAEVKGSEATEKRIALLSGGGRSD